MQTPIPCVIMRGGTSRGPFFLASDLPPTCRRATRCCSPSWARRTTTRSTASAARISLTSKVAMISRSKQPGADVDYLFAQVLINEALVDTKPNCGNMLVAVGPFAIEAGLVPAKHPRNDRCASTTSTRSRWSKRSCRRRAAR